MDAVSALSLAASVFSVIQISKDAIGIYSDLLETGSVSQYQATEAAARSLESSINELHEPLQAAVGSTQSDDHGDLFDIASKAVASAKDLQTMLKKLKKDSNGGILDAVKKTCRAITKRKDIERKKKNLDEYEKALRTRILTKVHNDTAKSAQGYEEVLQKLNGLGMAAEISHAKVAQAVSDHSELSAQTSKFLETLRFAEIHSRHEQIAPAHDMTFDWIFRGVEDLNKTKPRKWADFLEWLETCDSSESVYWIHGKAGSGKSTLMSHLVHHRRTHAALHVWCGQDSTLRTPCFFFWHTGSLLQKTIPGLLRSIAYQLLRGSNAILVELLTDDYHSRSQRFPMECEMAWTEQRLFDLLDRIIEISKTLGIYICFFVDGLDEYIGETDRLINFVVRVGEQRNVKLCVSSRPDQAYHQAFLHKPQLRLEDLTQTDIERYINDRLGSHLPISSSHQKCNKYRCQWGPQEDECPNGLISAVGQRASGVFLWVKLIVSDLLNSIVAGESIRQLRHSLEEIPVEIQDMFAHMLKKLPKRFLTSGVRYLSMILAAIKSDDKILHTRSFQRIDVLDVAFAEERIWNNLSKCDWSFALDPTFDEVCERLKKHILYCCAGLVEVQDSYEMVLRRQQSSKLNFIHRSVIDFLRTTTDPAVLLSAATIGEAHLLYVRAKTSLCSLYFSGCAEGFYIGPNALTQADLENLQHFLNGPSSRTFPSEIAKSVEEIETSLIKRAQVMENILFNLDKLEPSIKEACENTLICFISTLRHYDRYLLRRIAYTHSNNGVQCWKAQGFSVLFDSIDDNNLAYLVWLGFRCAIPHIHNYPSLEPSFFDSIVDCLLSSPPRMSWCGHINIVDIACVAFERGANPRRFVTINFSPYEFPTAMVLPCVQEAWVFLLWRIAFSVEEKGSDIIIQRIQDYLQYCLSWGANLDSACLIVVEEISGWYLQSSQYICKISAAAIIQRLLHWPRTERLSELMATCHAEPFERYEYYVGYDSTLYRLNDAQADRVYQADHECYYHPRAALQSEVLLPNWSYFRFRTTVSDKSRVSLERATRYIRHTINQATKLGSLKSGVIIGNDSTYQISDTEQDPQQIQRELDSWEEYERSLPDQSFRAIVTRLLNRRNLPDSAIVLPENNAPDS